MDTTSANALGQIDKPAVPALIKLLKNTKARPRARELAARTLGEIGPDARSALPALRQFAGQRGFLSIYAESALRQIDPRAERKRGNT